MINQYKGVLRKGFISYHHPTQDELAFNDLVKPLIEDAVRQGQDVVISNQVFRIQDVKYSNTEYMRFMDGLRFAHELGYDITYSSVQKKDMGKVPHLSVYKIYIRWDTFPKMTTEYLPYFDYGVEVSLVDKQVLRLPTENMCDAVIDLLDTYIKPLASPKGDVEIAKKVRIGRDNEIL